MKKHIALTTVGLAVTVLIGLGTTARVDGLAGQQGSDRSRQYGGSLDARQHGYEHAYRDGADQGRQDRANRQPYAIRNMDYWAQRTYEPAFGDRNQYIEGYREGYKAGYDDGFNGRDGQYGQLYARPQSGARVDPRDDPYANRPYSSSDMAFDAGYREGVTLGQQDRARNSRSNYRNSAAYRNGDLGYRSSYGDRNQYQLQFRDGVDRGYEDGFGRARSSDGGAFDQAGSPRRDSGNRQNGGRNYGRNGQASQGGTFTVPANLPWTPTGIRVNQGDVLHFTSSGEIHFTGNAADRAGVAGSPDHKFIGGAPLPTALAGALIGRIDNGLPFGIGDQTTITAPASGLLYLGTNDDKVSDNSGQFQVTISFAGR